MKAYSNRHIGQITYPILISLLMENMIGLTDTAFLGRVGEVELGASALAGVYYMAIFMLGFGFSIGVQILIARRNGEGRLREIGPIFQQGLLFLLFFQISVHFFFTHSRTLFFFSLFKCRQFFFIPTNTYKLLSFTFSDHFHLLVAYRTSGVCDF